MKNKNKTVSKKLSQVPTAAQADPETTDEELFGEEFDDGLADAEDFAAKEESTVADNLFQPLTVEEPTTLVFPQTHAFDGLPLNQVPGKLRKFLNNKEI